MKKSTNAFFRTLIEAAPEDSREIVETAALFGDAFTEALGAAMKARVRDVGSTSSFDPMMAVAMAMGAVAATCAHTSATYTDDPDMINRWQEGFEHVFNMKLETLGYTISRPGDDAPEPEPDVSLSDAPEGSPWQRTPMGG